MVNSLFLLNQFFDLLAHDLFALGFVPIQLAVPAVADVAFLVDQVRAWPVLIAPGFPGLEFVVHRNRVFDPVVLHFFLNRTDVSLSFRLRRVDAQQRDVFLRELFVPTLVPRVVVDAVDSAISPEVQDNDLALQVREFNLFAVDPVADSLQFRRGNLHGSRLLSGDCGPKQENRGDGK